VPIGLVWSYDTRSVRGYSVLTRSPISLFPPSVASAAPVVQAVAVSSGGGSCAGVLGGDA